VLQSRKVWLCSQEVGYKGRSSIHVAPHSSSRPPLLTPFLPYALPSSLPSLLTPSPPHALPSSLPPLLTSSPSHSLHFLLPSSPHSLPFLLPPLLAPPSSFLPPIDTLSSHSHFPLHPFSSLFSDRPTSLKTNQMTRVFQTSVRSSEGLPPRLPPPTTPTSLPATCLLLRQYCW